MSSNLQNWFAEYGNVMCEEACFGACSDLLRLAMTSMVCELLLRMRRGL